MNKEMILNQFDMLLSNLFDERFEERTIYPQLNDICIQNRLLFKELTNIVINHFINETNIPNKLKLINVIDSICKSTIDFNFIESFSPYIYSYFKECYLNSSLKDRELLFKIFYTWKYVFDKNILEKLKNELNLDEMKKYMEKKYNDLFKRYDDFNNDLKNNIDREKRKIDINNNKILVFNKTFDEDNVINKNAINLIEENENEKKRKKEAQKKKSIEFAKKLIQQSQKQNENLLNKKRLNSPKKIFSSSNNKNIQTIMNNNKISNNNNNNNNNNSNNSIFNNILNSNSIFRTQNNNSQINQFNPQQVFQIFNQFLNPHQQQQIEYIIPQQILKSNDFNQIIPFLINNSKYNFDSSLAFFSSLSKFFYNNFIFPNQMI